ncbi:unnamed protein product [Brassica rapa subsp. trilocularis]
MLFYPFKQLVKPAYKKHYLSKITCGSLIFIFSSFVISFANFLHFPFYSGLRFIFEFEIYIWV